MTTSMATEKQVVPACRYLHGPLRKLPETLVLCTEPPYPLRERQVCPAYVRVATWYCDVCSYLELHRDDHKEQG